MPSTHLLIINFVVVEESTSSDLPIDLNGIADIIMDDSTSQSGEAELSPISVKPPKDVIFNIHHNYQVHKLVISDHATVGE